MRYWVETGFCGRQDVSLHSVLVSFATARQVVPYARQPLINVMCALSKERHERRGRSEHFSDVRHIVARLLFRLFVRMSFTMNHVLSLKNC
ncbi:hypothetical protein ROD_41361 [Citrobacter rodentium ICC168]|uniref:Uncharacterized protein n=1 Tax=Citrobacter rodentium (strain ICC168) TaxID=637910 RepID=D2TIS4_CITRI|nr:hypothetical protein ROD_41361 [Citrobacter rodentium ICC168]